VSYYLLSGLATACGIMLVLTMWRMADALDEIVARLDDDEDDDGPDPIVGKFDPMIRFKPRDIA
jgi:hypothetical protein